MGFNRLLPEDLAASLTTRHALALGSGSAIDIGAEVGDDIAVIAPAATAPRATSSPTSRPSSARAFRRSTARWH